MTDKEIIKWIYGRLINHHGENPQYDYMLRLEQIIDKPESYKEMVRMSKDHSTSYGLLVEENETLKKESQDLRTTVEKTQKRWDTLMGNILTGEFELDKDAFRDILNKMIEAEMILTNMVNEHYNSACAKIEEEYERRKKNGTI